MRKKKDDSFRNRIVSTSTSSIVSNNSGQSRTAFVNYTNSFRYKNPKYRSQERDSPNSIIKNKSASVVEQSMDSPSKIPIIKSVKYKENPVSIRLKSVKLFDVAEEIDV